MLRHFLARRVLPSVPTWIVMLIACLSGGVTSLTIMNAMGWR